MFPKLQMKKSSYLLLIFTGFAFAQDSSTPAFKFAVSGDSRNCGDVVMPAIAAGARRTGADFYWHLGDMRAIYTFDEDLVPPAKLALPPRGVPLNVSTYLSSAWPDFIAHQIAPFGDLTVFLAIGNHETIAPSTRDAWLIQFADWLENPVIRAQRLKDDPTDRKLHSYYHWIQGNIDFITLDNVTLDQFDLAQLAWFHKVINRDEASPDIRTIVVGSHIALPGAIGHSHTMDDWPQGIKTGREVYEALWHARSSANKQVYVLASHSHFFMENVFRTQDWKGRELPGWIVGTAGAVRYQLPTEAGPDQKGVTNVYGFLQGTAMRDGSISFTYQKLSLQDLLAANQGKQPEPLVRWCFDENSNAR
jgi:Calcineurin-like phosphoesterase